MSNLIALCIHCAERGSEASLSAHRRRGTQFDTAPRSQALLGDRSHISLYEQGGIATVAHAFPRLVPNLADGTFDLVSARSGKGTHRSAGSRAPCSSGAAQMTRTSAS